MRAGVQTMAKAAPSPAFTPVWGGLLQRKCACGGAAGLSGACAECSKKPLQRRAANSAEHAMAPPIVHDVLHSSGQPLNLATRAFMEPRFGHDFSRVRVHTDAQAAESAQAVNAMAYTVGRDIVFGPGKYAPDTHQGNELLAHELTHTLQQGTGVRHAPNCLAITNPADAAEREAASVANAVMRGSRAAPTLSRPVSIERQVPAPAACANPGESRTVDLQPLFFKANAADPSPTGGSWPGRFNQTNAIWGKLGVTFNELASITLVDATNKTAGSTRPERDTTRALRSGSGVEVFVVDNDLPQNGGATTTGGGSAAAKVLMSDRGTSNTLLAHELGHVLGLGHNGTNSDPGTIMDTTGSHSTANPTTNTMANYGFITWPAPTGSTCLNPDP